MSATQPPRRRVSQKVYRRRRLVVLLGVLAVIVVVLLVILRPGSGKAETAAPATATPGATDSAGALGAATPAPAASGTGAGSAGTGAGDAGATPSAAPSAAATDAPAPAASETPADGSAACAAGNITVTAITDANDYSSGNLPMLSFSIVNTGSQPCTINAGTSQQVYTITSGTETYWLSTDCQTGATDTLAMLEPGKTITSTPFAWNRTRSSKDSCASTSPPAVPAGGAAYHLSVSVDGIASAQSAQFILE
ncbi:hypothetical protein [Subtercola endophyticus]|uniref:hypothetical protein n=1 Tax=Subtercola endophyticus TaxID=2895559 RepID=UPI001E29CF34|nr:hypothetical protein [Subtercola endophyticus]UFS59105.1 hypothetical protein LQ955_19355 [Subtercola endophyticus]